MWQLFKKCSCCFVCCLLFLNTSFSKEKKYSKENPYFIDSVLRTQIDTAKWQALQQNTNTHNIAKVQLIQQIKHKEYSNLYLMCLGVVIILLLIVRLIFEDFMYAIVEGLFSVKKFYAYYKTKKYDSLMAILLVMVLKIINIALLVYIIIQYYISGGFTDFNSYLFLKILLIITIFYIIKSVFELIFNETIGMKETYNAVYLFSFFTEFIASIIILIFLLIFIYNNTLQKQNVYIFLIGVVVFYTIFNIIRSFQLLDIFKIAGKLQFFVYVCTFKILPFLILVRYIFNNVIV